MNNVSLTLEAYHFTRLCCYSLPIVLAFFLFSLLLVIKLMSGGMLSVIVMKLYSFDMYPGLLSTSQCQYGSGQVQASPQGL